jgi:hypothetical protein
MQLSVAERRYEQLKASVAVSSLSIGPTAAGRQHGQTRKFAEYHENKLVDPTFHSGTWGGSRNRKFADPDQQIVEIALWDLVKSDPSRLPAQFAADLNPRITATGATVNAK